MMLAPFLSLMKEISNQRFGYYSISQDCGEFLSILLQVYAQSRDSVNVVEVGTGVGYSALWLAKGLIAAGGAGKVYTIERSPIRAQAARSNLKKASKIEGLERITDYVEIINGNGVDVIAELDVGIDFAFIDGAKDEYHKYLTSMIPKLSAGSVVTAHNTISHGGRMEDFVSEITNPEKWSTVILPIDAGLSISVKVS
ncbi:MAG: O-methyltransferase [Candidatus Hodarchaeota archaeon]